MEDIFLKGGLLANHFSRFEERQGQLAMARMVGCALGREEACDENQPPHLVVIEAETGIGKTLAYLVPALLSGKKVVISTATLNLQDQIVDKDLPLVETLLERSAKALCMKGRENYICLYRWFQLRATPQLFLSDDPDLEKIDRWLEKTTTGDRAELEFLNEYSPLWSRISARSTHCLGGDCPELSSCFITRLRKKAGAAQMLIVNHHLFFSDLALKNSGYGDLLPGYQAVIFDEAHHVENVVSTFFGKRFSHFQLIDLVADIEHQAQQQLNPDVVDELLPSLSGLRVRAEQFTSVFEGATGRFPLDGLIDRVTADVWRENVELLLTGIARVGDKLGRYTQYGESWAGLVKRAEELEQNLRHIALEVGPEDASFVRWYEKREKAVVLSTTPLEVAPVLHEVLYSNVETCILTSATLSTGGSFSYMKDRLGLDEQTRFAQFSSPFDYAHHSLLYIPGAGFPLPNEENYRSMLALTITEILRLTRGRALILCTSFKAMDELADVLRSNIEYTVLVQGEQSKKSLLARFRKEKESVLVAVASFWEGVDIAGESLSCVIIDKLPFEVPSDPVLKARIEQIKSSGRNPFFTFQVPRAVLSLRQGVGRLMRAASDRGVIAIMDVRLRRKSYGSTFLKSLPPSPVTEKMEDIETFFDGATNQ
ncbi:ATP-dependent DNA helicase [Desulforhopalus singaporensis]|uniref:ATP-dependent DNA helicase n=1 Tax=Desulforhopalus singaporensis TaxID=91360 RepID=UPI0015A455BB|nr:ATP-dependent DNA helicase [Desulforhopalus singaporensis]